MVLKETKFKRQKKLASLFIMITSLEVSLHCSSSRLHCAGTTKSVLENLMFVLGDLFYSRPLARPTLGET